MKRKGLIALAVIAALVTCFFLGATASEQYERNHLEYIKQQNRLLAQQNDLLREQVTQVRRIADLMEKRQRQN